MFSSNQVFQISGDMSQLEESLRFALSFYGKTKNLVFQTTGDGKYCIGWKPDGGVKGWDDFQFDFDISIVAKIIEQFIRKQKTEESGYEWCDGSTDQGFLMKSIPKLFSDEYKGIKQPFYGIVSFEPFCNFYSK